MRTNASGRVLVAGATGYIGRHVVSELARRGWEVVALARPRSGVGGVDEEEAARARLAGAEVRFCDVTSASSLAQSGFQAEAFDAVVSCLASRTGGVKDAWRVEHEAQVGLLAAARAAGARRFLLLSAICVQKPRLAFQRAKLAFEAELERSGIPFTIIRPTAFFKSLAGQIERVRAGRPFLMFGDGEATACRPIGEADLARFIADALEDPSKENAVLPIGGPGPLITPRRQAELLFEALERPMKVKRVPLALMGAIAGSLGALSRVWPGLRDKAELARIGHYYASESMLVWDAQRGAYDAEATPVYGTETLADFYARVARQGLDGQELGDHAVFSRKAG